MRTGLSISALGHVVIALSCYATLASPTLFNSHPLEAITVDIVSPAELTASLPAQPSSPAEAPKAEPPRTEMTASAPPAPSLDPTRQMPRLEASAMPTPPAPSAPPLASRLAGMLHLPKPQSGSELHKDEFDAPALTRAKLSSDDIAAFRAQVTQCWTAPPGFNAAQRLRMVIRLSLEPGGALSDEPMLVEASASPGGPAFLKSLVAALQRCQPYRLPAEKYQEWRVLDVVFSPQLLTGG